MSRGLSRQFGGRLYSRSLRPRIWRGGVLAAALALSAAGGGCSMSYQLNSLFGDSSNDITGSISPPAHSIAKLPPEDDLAYARAAVSQVLAYGSKDASQPWENPNSGARGTVTPITSAYTQGGQTCRDFLASYIKGRSEAWLQGEACKHHTGPWEVRSMKPWKSS